MSNVDRVFIDFDQPNAPLPTGITEYREERKDQGDYVFDLRFSYKVKDRVKIAFIVNNLLNREYMIRPLQVESPRTFGLQFTLDL